MDEDLRSLLNEIFSEYKKSGTKQPTELIRSLSFDDRARDPKTLTAIDLFEKWAFHADFNNVCFNAFIPSVFCMTHSLVF